MQGRPHKFHIKAQRPYASHAAAQPLRRPCRRVILDSTPRAFRACERRPNRGRELKCTGRDAMRRRSAIVGIIARAALAGASPAALAAAVQAAEYKMTVNSDRLINSAREPQNW